jgi:rhodanese-related sulfurtransferase
MSFFKVLQILAISSLLAGYSAWIRSSSSVKSIDLTSSDQAGDCKIRLVRLSEAKALWAKGSTIFLDVRSIPDFAYGHIRGALSLPWEEFDDRFADVRPRLREAKTIVVYCKSVDCAKSLWTCLRLRKEGFINVLIYPNGWYEWADHGLPAERDSKR